MQATADICDELGETSAQVLRAAWRSFGGRKRFHGEVATVRCFEDNSVVKRVVEERGNGRVLVVDGAGSVARALFGDMMGAKAVKNGWAGVVVFGAVRDVAQLAEMDVGVVALATCPRKSNQRGAGEAGVPVEINGLVVKPGSFVVVDEDGVVVLPGGKATLPPAPKL